jgi:RimJ/RimL family protein N-acetyltransferase
MHMQQVEPVVLQGQHVRLEPLRLEHAMELYAISQYPDIWRYMPYKQPASVSEMEAWIAAALQAQERGVEVPFAIIDRSSHALGSTRYLNITPKDRALEIGWTWLTVTARRTPVNTECKYLLLRHAFEALGAIRVQFKTDSRNMTSQRAIERIGAVKEGVLRNHVIMPDGYYRHSVYYSIIESEWPMVKAHLESRLSIFG